VSNIIGKSGRAILNAIVAGETAAGDLATYTSDRVKRSREEFELALEADTAITSDGCSASRSKNWIIRTGVWRWSICALAS
jgi:hypothetical protein